MLATLTAATDASAEKKKREWFYFRAGPALILPLENSDPLVLSDVDGAASLAVENGPIEGSAAGVSNSAIPAVIIGFVLPWLDGRLSIETILGTPLTIKFQAKGTLATESIAPEALGIPTGVPPLGSELGETKAIPPTVTVVYRWPVHPKITPYVGLGLSYLIPFDSKITNPILTEVNQPDFEIDKNVGYVFQGGAETRVWRNVFVSLDVKFIAGFSTRGVVSNMHVNTPGLPLFETVRVGTATMQVRVNPLIVSLGTGMNF